jgi:hypothetical protein
VTLFVVYSHIYGKMSGSTVSPWQRHRMAFVKLTWHGRVRLRVAG